MKKKQQIQAIMTDKHLIIVEQNAFDICKSTNTSFQRSTLIVKKTLEQQRKQAKAEIVAFFLNPSYMRIIYNIDSCLRAVERSKRSELTNLSDNIHLTFVSLQSPLKTGDCYATIN